MNSTKKTWRKSTMKMQDIKNNHYSIIRSCFVLVLTIALVLSAFTFSFGIQTSANPLAPPNIPNNPMPVNGSVNVSITQKLNWTGGDPDNDPVKYDVYFGTKSTPTKKVSNQSALNYNPGTMNYSTLYYWRIIAWDSSNASTAGPLWHFTTEPKPNSPPNIPSNPSPSNGALNVLKSAKLSWTGGDPDNNPVKYDVYFGTSTTPQKVSSNQTATTYTPASLALQTKYNWKIVAWDNHSASTAGPLWSFTTKALPTVTISKPLINTLYFQDTAYLAGVLPFTFIYGPINITADASSGIGIDRVEFYVDGELIGEDSTADYICSWNPTDLKTELALTHLIKVIAYDNEGDSSISPELNVTKWRFHQLPFIIGAGAIGSLFLLNLIPHTTVTGLFLDVQQSLFSTSFYALRVHYWSSGPFHHERGVINFKSCTGGMVYGPVSMLQIGPLKNIMYGTFSFFGEINIYGGGFSGLPSLRSTVTSPTT